MRLTFKKEIFIVIIVSIISAIYYYNFQRIVSSLPLVIGPDTTFFSGPLNASGSIDYARAVNLLDKIDPQNNSAVEFLNIFGCELISPDLMKQERFLKLIGIASSSLGNSCYKPLINDKTREKSVFSKKITFFRTAWAKKDFPQVANWIKENNQTLKLLTKASEQRYIYWPLNGGGNLIDCDLLPSRELSNDFLFSFALFRARAMNRLYNQDYSGSWSDIVVSIKATMHLLKTRNNLTFIIGIVQLQHCIDTALAVINDTDVPSDQLHKIISDLAKLEKLPDVEKISEFNVRFTPLSTISNMSKDPEFLSKNMNSGKDVTNKIERYIDVNSLLRKINHRASKILAAEKTQPVSARIKVLRELSAKREALIAKMSATNITKKYLMWYLFEPSTTKVTALTQWIFEPILLNTQLGQGDLLNIRDECQQKFKLLAVAARVKAFQKENKKFPDQLSDLPSIASDTILDLFSNSPFVYKTNAEEALIYSVGSNLKDDGGAEDIRKDYDISVIVKKI